MIRSDIQVFVKKNSTTIMSNENQFTFSKNQDEIRAFSTAPFSMSMLDDIESSGIVSVNCFSLEKGSMVMDAKSFYTVEKMTDIIVSVFEKYHL